MDNNENKKVKVFMSIWEKDDTELVRGFGRYFETIDKALESFYEIKEGLKACLIDVNDNPMFIYQN